MRRGVLALLVVVVTLVSVVGVSSAQVHGGVTMESTRPVRAAR